jgi:hypothetical protein
MTTNEEHARRAAQAIFEVARNEIPRQVPSGISLETVFREIILREFGTEGETSEFALRLRLDRAEKMAKVIDDWTERQVIDTRSALVDARLNFGKPYEYPGLLTEAASRPADPKEKHELEGNPDSNRCGISGNAMVGEHAGELEVASRPADSPQPRTIEALNEYMDVRTRLGVLEMNEGKCNCEEFHTCDHCKEQQDLNHESRRLMNLWGDNWATLLWSYREEVNAALGERQQ